MRRKKLILCDPEADYAQQMAAFLEKDKDFPWEVTVFSDWKDVVEYTGKGQEEKSLAGNNYIGNNSMENNASGKHLVEILLLAESLVGEELPRLAAGELVLLNESGVVRFPEIRQINKYQEAENVRKELLRLFTQQEETIYPALQTEKETRIIGLYSPVRRCMQTSFGITYSQLLAESGRVLYLNFGYYADMPQMEPREAETDLGALMYYLESEQNKFFLHMKSMLLSIGNWDYISSIRNGTDLPGIVREEWLELIRRCKVLGEYDFIVLDLNESMQGLFDILRQCWRIFTIEKEDPVSLHKQEKYEYVLERNGYGDVKEKTIRLKLPAIDRFPATLEEYTRGELAEYVRETLCGKDKS